MFLRSQSSLWVAIFFLGGGCRPGSQEGAPMADSTDGDPFRGTVILGQDARFRACDAVRDVPIVDRTGGELERAYGSLAGPSEPSGEEVYVEGLGVSSPGEASLTVLELWRASPRGEHAGCARSPSRATLVARGNEPFWSVTVGPERIVYQDPEHLEGIVFPGWASDSSGGAPDASEAPTSNLGGASRTSGGAQGVSDSDAGVTPDMDTWGQPRVYRSRLRGTGAREIVVRVEPRPCADSMSGEYMHLTAEVRLDERELHGCAALEAP